MACVLAASFTQHSHVHVGLFKPSHTSGSTTPVWRNVFRQHHMLLHHQLLYHSYCHSQ